MEQRKSEAEVALELMRLVLERAGSRRLSPPSTSRTTSRSSSSSRVAQASSSPEHRPPTH